MLREQDVTDVTTTRGLQRLTKTYLSNNYTNYYYYYYKTLPTIQTLRSRDTHGKVMYPAKLRIFVRAQGRPRVFRAEYSVSTAHEPALL